MNPIAKTIVSIVAIRAAVFVALLMIGHIADRCEKKRLVKDAEHYANCPKNRI